MLANASHGITRNDYFMAGAIAAIWLAVAAVSIFAPDLVSGSGQDRVPLAALTAWFWGVVGTGSIVLVLAVRRQQRGLERTTWPIFGAALVLIWAVVAVIGIFGPELVTGSDPTRVPLAALIAPFAGGVLTMLLSVGALVASGDTAGARPERQ